MNLSSVFYESVQFKRFVLAETSFNKVNVPLVGDLFECSVKLKPISSKEPHYLYGDSHGTGTNKHRKIAFYKAVSEGFERWAYLETLRNNKNDVGIEACSSSTGFAAFPGLFGLNAKVNAIAEAIERWTLLHFWFEGLAVTLIEKTPHNHIYSISTPFKEYSVVLVINRNLSSKNPRTTYGFSCRKKTNLAIQHALTEAERNSWALDQLPHVNAKKLGLYERRLVHFSTNGGYNLVQERLKVKIKSVPPLPKKIIDRRIKGPWSKFCQVHRVLYQSSFYNKKDLNTFEF